MTMDNKRRRERSEMFQEIDLSTSDGPVIRVQGINISESGMLCRSDVEIAEGTFVIFKITLPGGNSNMCINCEGMVLKCIQDSGKYNVVIDFTDSDC